MYFFELQIGTSVLLDLVFGDPRWMPHPVRLIGIFCSRSETIFRRLITSERFAGLVTVLSVLTLTLGLSTAILTVLRFYSLTLAGLFAIYLLYTSFAARDLVVHSRVVYNALHNSESLAAARQAVAQIVGRDTEALDRQGVVRACVETVAENMVDGVTAPLFYAVAFSLFAPLTGIEPLSLAVFGAMGYKAVNTMDSMFGYKNDTYLLFGRVAARLDDVVNFIPARITGLILIPTAFFLGLDWKNAFMVLKEDRLSHASPNAAHPEAAVAGALTIQLGGSSIYFGKEVMKPVIGKAGREIEERDILRTNKLMLLGSFFFLLLLFLLRLSTLYIFT
ncbi:MAG: adenosylcobinamide-phosphate synthase CbiB [Thermodesulfobacteriota bacterium]|nr:adenosylcobinamide-phosphate synthase CbiB [Thermodesulfobacteriota bacterium]